MHVGGPEFEKTILELNNISNIDSKLSVAAVVVGQVTVALQNVAGNEGPGNWCTRWSIPSSI